MRGENLLAGANFASTDFDILNDTGVQFVNIIRIAQHLQNFEDYQQRLATYVGEDAARERMSQSLVLITLGGNDFFNNYCLVPFSARSQQFEIHGYISFNISEYKKVLAVIIINLFSYLPLINSQTCIIFAPKHNCICKT
ncbi:unnamed protein product [Triticum turgidum subsp. durum]|uniref:GDSL esterase/lipase n=1 Tax=Triticum turgidum subsp. durum TaxID=4567 RepID=A0A9R0TDE2_TRITD|nr:unnamed protein product [Triticum turgidum subsp. durum]